jgi:hypothetical protein
LSIRLTVSEAFWHFLVYPSYGVWSLLVSSLYIRLTASEAFWHLHCLSVLRRLKPCLSVLRRLKISLSIRLTASEAFWHFIVYPSYGVWSLVYPSYGVWSLVYPSYGVWSLVYPPFGIFIVYPSYGVWSLLYLQTFLIKNTGVDLECPRRVSSFCSTSGSHHAAVKRHQYHLIWKIVLDTSIRS